MEWNKNKDIDSKHIYTLTGGREGKREREGDIENPNIDNDNSLFTLVYYNINNISIFSNVPLFHHIKYLLSNRKFPNVGMILNVSVCVYCAGWLVGYKYMHCR